MIYTLPEAASPLELPYCRYRRMGHIRSVGDHHCDPAHAFWGRDPLGPGGDCAGRYSGDVSPLRHRPARRVIRRARMPGGGEWKHIPPPDAGLRVTRDDLLIQAGTLARFEEEHGVFLPGQLQPDQEL